MKKQIFIENALSDKINVLFFLHRCDFWLEILDDVRRYRNFLSTKPPLTEHEVLTLPNKVHEEL